MNISNLLSPKLLTIAAAVAISISFFTGRYVGNESASLEYAAFLGANGDQLNFHSSILELSFLEQKQPEKAADMIIFRALTTGDSLLLSADAPFAKSSWNRLCQSLSSEKFVVGRHAEWVSAKYKNVGETLQKIQARCAKLAATK